MNYRDNFSKELVYLSIFIMLSDREIRGCECANIDCITFVVHIHPSFLFEKCVGIKFQLDAKA